MASKILKGTTVLADEKGNKVAIFVTMADQTKSAIVKGLSPEKKKEVKAKLDTVKTITDTLESVYFIPGYDVNFKAMKSPYGVFEALREAAPSVGWSVLGESKYDLPPGDGEDVLPVPGWEAYLAEFEETLDDRTNAAYWEWADAQEPEKQ